MRCDYIWRDYNNQQVRCEFECREIDMMSSHRREHCDVADMNYKCSLCSFNMRTISFAETHIRRCHSEWLSNISVRDSTVHRPRVLIKCSKDISKLYTCEYAFLFRGHRHYCAFRSHDVQTMDDHMKRHMHPLRRGWACGVCLSTHHSEQDTITHCSDSHNNLYKLGILTNNPSPILIQSSIHSKTPDLLEDEFQPGLPREFLVKHAEHDDGTEPGLPYEYIEKRTIDQEHLHTAKRRRVCHSESES